MATTAVPAAPRTSRRRADHGGQRADRNQGRLTPFVSGASEASAQAIANIRRIWDEHLIGRHRLSIVDLNQEPNRAPEHHVLATPTLIKDHPLPSRMLVGDMSDHVRILLALDVTAADPVPPIAASA